MISSSSAIKTNFNNAFSNEEASIYAKVGEPMYLKEMDSDEDGKVTFDEFREYCKVNGLSKDEIVNLLELRTMYKMMQASKEKQEEQEEDKSIYSKKEDKETDEQTASDFEEYIEYCKQNAKVEDSNKISNAYNFKEPKEEKIKIKAEA